MSFAIEQLLDPTDLGQRWSRARVAAVQSASKLTQSPSVVSLDKGTAYEAQAVAELPPQQHAAVLRQVFENSKKLGISARWHFGAEWELEDFSAVFGKLDLPCLVGTWTCGEEHAALSRPGCSLGLRYGEKVCDYYREAIDGLTLGLSDEVNFSRHQCCTKGATKCRDQFYSHKIPYLAFLPLSEELHLLISNISQELRLQGVSSEFPGTAEGVLYYKWQNAEPSSCKDLSALVSAQIKTMLAENNLEMQIKDISPKAVIGPGAGDGLQKTPRSNQNEKLVTLQTIGNKKCLPIVN